MDTFGQFIIGGNWRVIEYGQNFGANAWFPAGNGVTRHRDSVSDEFRSLQRAGVDMVRVGLLDDGRNLFDADGGVTGYGTVIREDIRLFLDLALLANVKVEFYLLDFLIAGKPDWINGVLIRGRPALFLDEIRRKGFIDDFLSPMLVEFGHHPALFGFDVINEPEWIVAADEGGAWEGITDTARRAERPIPRNTMDAFISDCIATIRAQAPAKCVTVGVSGVFLPLVQDLDLDYLAPHHYPWMGDFQQMCDFLPEGKPWLLEEFPTRNSPMTVSDYMEGVWKAGGSGALLWNLTAGIDDYTFPQARQESILAEVNDWILGKNEETA